MLRRKRCGAQVDRACGCRYAVDYRVAGFNHWGYQAGCEFVESSAKEVTAGQDSAVQRFTCQRELSASTECTVDLTSLGVCIADSSFDGLSHVQVRPALASNSPQSVAAPTPPHLVASHGMIRGGWLLSQ